MRPVSKRLVVGVLALAALLLCWWSTAGPTSAQDPSAVDPGTPIVATLGADGDVSLWRAGWSGARRTLATGTLRHEELRGLAADLEQIRKAFAGVTANPAVREPSGDSKLRLVVDGDGRANWKYVQLLMQVAAHPGLRIRRIELRDSRTALHADVLLPRDEGLAPRAPEPSDLEKVRVRLFRKAPADVEAAFTRVRLGTRKQPYDLPSAGAKDAARAYASTRAGLRRALAERLQAIAAAKRRAVVEIVAPPPTGGRVPFADVLMLVRLAQELGVPPESILYEGAAPPLFPAQR